MGSFPGIISTGSSNLADIGELGDVQPDDYILCFPVESGIQPLYVMLRDRRDYPGVVTKGVEEAMESSPDTGDHIPPNVALGLEGRVFERFQELESAILNMLPDSSNSRIMHRIPPKDGGGVYELKNLRLAK